MPARISIEDLRPAGAREDAPAPRTRRGARVRAAAATLEPRDAGGILDLALDGLIARFGPALGVALLLWMPFGHVRTLFGLAGLDALSVQMLEFGWSLLQLVPQALALAVAVSLVGDHLTGGERGVARSIARGLWSGLPVLLILIATQVLTAPLAVLCVFPYVLVYWLTFAAVPMYVLEGMALLTPAEQARAHRGLGARLGGSLRRVGRAIAASVRLSTGWPSLGRWLLVTVVGLWCLIFWIEFSAAMLYDPDVREFLRNELALKGGAADFLVATISGLLLALGAALRGALMTAFYLDLCVRRRGLDLELALRRLPGAQVAEAG